MNKSIFSKNEITRNFLGKNSNGINLLSATSSDFMSQINPRFNMKGGSCPCMRCLEAFEEGNVELALYIFNEGNCCCRCKDNNGNTILHNLILCANSGNLSSKDKNGCRKAIAKLVNSDIISSCIDIQNNNGVTPMLLAVMKGDEETAELLDKAGANKSIKDKNGNYIKDDDEDAGESTYDPEIDRLLKAKRRLDSDMSTLDLGSDIRREIESSDVPVFARGKNSMEEALNDYGKMLIIVNDKQPLPDRTVGNGDVVYAELRSTQPGHDEEINLVTAKEISNVMNKLMADIEEPVQAPVQAPAQAKPSVVATRVVEEETDEGSKIAIESDTDQLLQELKREYEKKSSQQPATSTVSRQQTATKTMSKKNTPMIKAVNQDKAQNADAIDSNVDTDALMDAITRISSQKINSSNNTKQSGGADKKTGYRRLIETSDENSEMSFSNTSNSEYSVDSDYDELYNEDNKEGGASNELSRMMQSQKDKLHEQVLDMIMSMLNKGELVKDSEPIKANERSAKLIKAYIYRQVSEKNPQLGGLDKILMISKMSDSQIADMVKEMPDLDDLEKTIQKHLEEKKANRPAKKEKKSKKEVSSEESDTLADLTITETVETTDSEKPKKKATKATKATKAKKTSKK